MAEMDAFERSLAGALSRLADDASGLVDAAAVAHRVAAEHPRRRVRALTWGAFTIRRPAMVLVIAVLLVGLVASLLVVGSRPPIVPSPTASPSPSATATVTPVTGAATLESCIVRLSCAQFADDPRVSGTVRATWTANQWPESTPQEGGFLFVPDDTGAGWHSGTRSLENSGGTWDGRSAGVYSADRGTIIATWYKGGGGYEGLGYFEVLTESRGEAKIRGMIFPGDPPNLADIASVMSPAPSPNVPPFMSPAPAPTPVPAPTPTAIAYGRLSAVQGVSDYAFTVLGVNSGGPEGVTHYRDGTVMGVDRANDPRVSGEFLASSWTTNLWGATSESLGAGTQWGLRQIENVDGTWMGVGSGIFDDDGDLIAIWYTGSGRYIGLAYFELIGRPDLFNPNADAKGNAVFGLIFPGDPPKP